jgi:hypothetical protein
MRPTVTIKEGLALGVRGFQMPAKLSMKSLAQFMTSGESRRRTILRNSKFPRAAKIIIIQYRDAINTIRDFHESGNDPASLVKNIDKLRKKAMGATRQTEARINNNIRAIERYVHSFGANQSDVKAVPKMKYIRGTVTISVFPDLLIEQNGESYLIKLDFTAQGATDEQIEIMLHLMYESASAEDLGIPPKNVLYINARSPEPHRGSKIKKSLKKEIDAACENIEAIWEGIKR